MAKKVNDLQALRTLLDNVYEVEEAHQEEKSLEKEMNRVSGIIFARKRPPKPEKNCTESKGLRERAEQIKKKKIKNWIIRLLALCASVICTVIYMEDFLTEDWGFLLIWSFIPLFFLVCRKGNAGLWIWTVIWGFLTYGITYIFVGLSGMVDTDDKRYVFFLVLSTTIVIAKIVAFYVETALKKHKVEQLIKQAEEKEQEEEATYKQMVADHEAECERIKADILENPCEELELIMREKEASVRRRVAVEAEIAACDVVSDDDKTVEVVEFLIDKIETGRADTIKEALNMYDGSR